MRALNSLGFAKWLGVAVATVVVAVIAPAATAEASSVKMAFVDTGNTGRSITAETMARIYAVSHNVDARFISRGIEVNPYEIKVEMNAQILWMNKGIDLSSHIATQLTPQDIKRSDIILTLTQTHKAHILATFKDAAGKTFTITEYAGKGDADVEDAWGKPMDVYVRMFAELNALVPVVVEKAAQEKAAREKAATEAASKPKP
ncbi:MAG: protein tyrosine phosphatase [Pseudomonadota bacterium]